MVTNLIASKDFNWKPEVVEGDDPRLFAPEYSVSEEAGKTVRSLRSGFEKMPSSGIWKNRLESDEELLEELGRGWRGFACEQ
jgi:hypothetical protein